MSNFYGDLMSLINRCSVENDSDTPDFILAKYIENCLDAYNRAVKDRDDWYNFTPWTKSIRQNKTIEYKG